MRMNSREFREDFERSIRRWPPGGRMARLDVRDVKSLDLL